MLVVLQGCSTAFKFSPPVVRLENQGSLINGKTIQVNRFEGNNGECFYDETVGYLRSAQVNVVSGPDSGTTAQEIEEFAAKSNVDIVISGSIDKFGSGSDTITRNATVYYFLVFGITAPIAAIYAVSTRWNAFGVLSGKMTIIDFRSYETIWSKRVDVTVTAEGKGLDSEEEIMQVLLSRTCKDLTTKMLNDFLSTYNTIGK